MVIYDVTGEQNPPDNGPAMANYNNQFEVLSVGEFIKKINLNQEAHSYVPALKGTGTHILTSCIIVPKKSPDEFITVIEHQ